jgi:putative transposase
LAELSADERAIALERFRLLEPHLQDGRELRSIADRTSVSFRTLQRWVAGYKRDGLPGLLRKVRADSG